MRLVILTLIFEERSVFEVSVNFLLLLYFMDTKLWITFWEGFLLIQKLVFLSWEEGELATRRLSRHALKPEE